MELLSWIIVVLGVAALLIVFLLNYSGGSEKQRNKKIYIEDIRDKQGRSISSIQADIPAGALSEDQQPVVEDLGVGDIQRNQQHEQDREASQQAKHAHDNPTAKDLFAEDSGVYDDRVVDISSARKSEQDHSAEAAPQTGRKSWRHDEIGEELQLALFIAAREKNGIPGVKLLQALESSGLQFGDMDIFHRMVGSEYGQLKLFSVANGIKPWTLKPEDIRQQSTPGISLVMHLPTSMDNVEAMEFFLASARILADEVDGDLLNPDHVPLNDEDRPFLLALAERMNTRAQMVKETETA